MNLKTLINIIVPPGAATLTWITFPILAFLEWRDSNVMIDGHPDNAPYHASLMLLVLTPLAYIGLLIVQGVFLVLQRLLHRSIFLLYLVAIGISALLGGFAVGPYEHGDRWLFGLIALGASASFLLPMACCSWAITRFVKVRHDV